MTDKYSDFTEDAERVINALEMFLQSSIKADGPVINQKPMAELIEQLNLEQHLTEGSLTGDQLGEFLVEYLNQCTKLHHPGFLAQQVAPSHPNGGLGSLIDGVTNNAMAIYEMGPSASAIEYFMLNWMLSHVGWRTVSPDSQLNPQSNHAGGTLTHGGSLGNLTALLAARSARFPQSWQEGTPDNLVVLVPEQSHYSLKRTIGMLGIGTNNCQVIPADDDGKVAPQGLEQLIRQLQTEGKQILAVVANGCGTAVGLYDEINPIADICEKHGIWLHLDAAHGGMALLSKRYRHLFSGVERVDSIVWDAHKMMMTPTLCAAVLVRDHRHLDNAFQTEASYLIHEKDQPGFDFLLRNLECTKAGLGLRFFMSVAAQGEASLVRYYEDLVQLTERIAAWIAEQPDMRLAVQPETNILCFQLTPDGYADDQLAKLQFQVRDELLREGNFYISTTEYQGHRWLRLVIMNSNTSWQHLMDLMTALRRISKQLS